MKKLICLLPVICLAVCLSACGCDDSENVDLVFVNDTTISISYVTAESAGHSGGAKHADSSPLNRGETFGFEVDQYPVTLTVYGMPAGKTGEVALGRITVNGAPPEERWYITARDGKGGLTLTAGVRWPEGV